MSSDALRCRICASPALAPHFWPKNEYLGRVFSFFACEDCGSLSVHPMPDAAVLEAMYGDLYRQSSEASPHDAAGPRFDLSDHQRIALEFLDTSRSHLAGCRSLLDYGCGNGHYLVAARRLGMDPVGVEFSPVLAQRVEAHVGAPVFEAQSFGELCRGRTFDVVHLSHVLEHVPDPLATLEQVKRFAHGETRFVIDGPLEVNRYLGRILVDLVSRMQRRPVRHGMMPLHVSFTSARSQQLFFARGGLQTLRFAVAEQAYPLPRPSQIEWRSARSVVAVALAQASILVSRLLPGWGNVFHFVGVARRDEAPGDSGADQRG